MMKSAFTMIELIFAIVIIGILAAIATPKLAATRSDAEGTAVVSSLANCISEAGNHFMMVGSFNSYTQDGNLTSSCQKAKECFTLTENDSNGSLKVENKISSENKCREAQEIAAKNLLLTTNVINF